MTNHASRFDWEKAARRAGLAKMHNGTVVAVAFVLATYANADGTSVRPSQKGIADGLGLSRDRVSDAIKKLRADGWIELVQERPLFSRVADEYRLSIPSDVVSTGHRQMPHGEDALSDVASTGHGYTDVVSTGHRQMPHNQNSSNQTRTTNPGFLPIHDQNRGTTTRTGTEQDHESVDPWIGLDEAEIVRRHELWAAQQAAKAARAAAEGDLINPWAIPDAEQDRQPLERIEL